MAWPLPARRTPMPAIICVHTPEPFEDSQRRDCAFAVSWHGDAAWSLDDTLRVVGVTGGFVSEALS